MIKSASFSDQHKVKRYLLLNSAVIQLKKEHGLIAIGILPLINTSHSVTSFVGNS